MHCRSRDGAVGKRGPVMARGLQARDVAALDARLWPSLRCMRRWRGVADAGSGCALNGGGSAPAGATAVWGAFSGVSRSWCQREPAFCPLLKALIDPTTTSATTCGESLESLR